MKNEKFFKTLPENQKYLYAGFDSVSRDQGCLCDECGTYIQNIVSVRGSVDNVVYHLGLTCCKKQAKVEDGLDLSDKVMANVKFFEGKLRALSKFRKNFDEWKSLKKTEVIQAHILRNKRTGQLCIDFGFLYEDGDWHWMHSDFIFNHIWKKVKETFSDIWDQIDWVGFEEVAKAETDVEKWKALDALKVIPWGEWNEKNQPEWERKSNIRNSIEYAMKTGRSDSKVLKLPSDFKKEDYSDIFDFVLQSMGEYYSSHEYE